MEFVDVVRFKKLATKEKEYRPRFIDGVQLVLGAQAFKRARDAEAFGRAQAARAETPSEDVGDGRTS